MALSTGQKRALHAAARQAGFDDSAPGGIERRRMVMRTVGGFHSAADRTATREGYIHVMAYFEQLAGGCLRGCTRGYWTGQSKVARPADSLIWRIRRECERLGMSPEQLDRWIAGPHMSAGECKGLADAPEHWLRKIVEALKAIGVRRGDAERQEEAAPF
ncbi:MAG: hypothetical protein ACE15C_14630 [Phycisphaerae bacterium]